VRLSGHSLVLIAAAGVLFIISFAFDSLPALLPAGSILGLLLARAFLFLRSAGIFAGSVRVTRDAAPVILRQGRPVSVTCTVHFSLPHGLAAEITDLPPAGAPVTRGSVTATRLSPGSHLVTLTYGVSCISCGRLFFRGVDIVLHDSFFSILLPFRGGETSLPSLWVDPVARTRTGDGVGMYGERETDALRALQGYGVRGFRGYLPGDEPRSIDWKLTAKHGRLYVREYTGLMGKNPLLVVDLPDSAVPCPPALRDAVLGAALAAVREMSRSPRGCSLMVISGPNLLSFLHGERSIVRLERALREYHSPQQVFRCYRAIDPAVAASFRQRIKERVKTGELFFRRLDEIHAGFLPAIEPLPFEVQCARALAREGDCALHVLSPGWGDSSHLGLLGFQARRRGIDARIGIPDAALSPDLVRRLRGYGYTIVRVMA